MGVSRRKNRLRILGTVAAAVTLLGAVTACSSGGSSGGTTLTMWTFKQSHVKALEDAAAAFKAKTGITVQITAYTPDATFNSKVQSAAATHNLADVIELHAAGEDYTFGGAGILENLASSVDSAWKARFLPGTADAGLITQTVYKASLQPKSTDPGVKPNELFSVPFTAGTFGIIYANKSKLQAAGLDPTKPPTTWEQFIAWMKATHTQDPANGGVTLGLNVSSTGLDWALEPMAYGELGKSAYEALFGKDSAHAWGSPNGLKVLDLYNEMTPYWTAGDQTLGIDQADLAFAQGKSAFDVGGTFTGASIEQDGMSTSDFVAFAIPAPAGGAVSDLKLAAIALTGLSISAQSKNQSAALQWINFLTTQAQAGVFAKTAYDLPAVNLGPNGPSIVGSSLSSLEAAFGSGDSAYNPGDTTFMGPTWNITDAGNILVQMSPLQKSSPDATNAALATYNANTWK